MSDNLKDILSNLNPDIDQETLMRYLQGKLSPEEQHEVEKGLMNDEFEADALEGLQDFKDRQKISALVEGLNRDLKKKTEKKNKSAKKRKVTIEPWLIIALVLILLIAVIGYLVVHKKMSGQ